MPVIRKKRVETPLNVSLAAESLKEQVVEQALREKEQRMVTSSTEQASESPEPMPSLMSLSLAAPVVAAPPPTPASSPEHEAPPTHAPPSRPRTPHALVDKKAAHEAFFRRCTPSKVGIEPDTSERMQEQPAKGRCTGFYYKDFATAWPAMIKGEEFQRCDDRRGDGDDPRRQRRFNPHRQPLSAPRVADPEKQKHLENVHNQPAEMTAYSRRATRFGGWEVAENLEMLEELKTECGKKTINMWRDLGGLDEQLCAGVTHVATEQPFPVQRNVFKLISIGRGRFDVYMHAPTGTGKTLAFLLPILNYCVKARKNGHSTNRSHPLALILSPTRTLAYQTYQRVRDLLKASEIELGVSLVVGGCEYDRHQNDRTIIIATPGRLREEVVQKELYKLDSLQFVVFDEAEKLDDGEFMKNLEDCYQYIPNETRENLMTIACSATLRLNVFNSEFGKWSPMTQNRFVYVTVGEIPEQDSRKFRVLKVTTQMSRLYRLVDVLLLDLNEQEIEYEIDPATEKLEIKGERVGRYRHSFMVFVNRRNKAVFLASYLLRRGFDAAVVTGDLSLSDRQSEIQKVDDEMSAQVLISTNMCSRGFDPRVIDHVILYDLDSDDSIDTQRMGRVGRAGADGFVTFFVSLEEDAKRVASLSQFLFDRKQSQPKWMWEARKMEIATRREYAELAEREQQPAGTEQQGMDEHGWSTHAEAEDWATDREQTGFDEVRPQGSAASSVTGSR